MKPDGQTADCCAAPPHGGQGGGVVVTTMDGLMDHLLPAQISEGQSITVEADR